MQANLKKHTASIRHVLLQGESDLSQFYKFRDKFIENVNKSVSRHHPTSSNPTELVAIAEIEEYDELMKQYEMMLMKWRRISSLTFETYAETLSRLEKDNTSFQQLEYENNKKQLELQRLWDRNNEIQAEIAHLETILGRDNDEDDLKLF